MVHGLTRVRGMTQDDAHIYCTREQMRDELASLLTFVLDLLRDYGLDDFYLELSTKDPDKYVGSDEVWEEATATLRGGGRRVRARPGARPGRRRVLRARRSRSRPGTRSAAPGRCRPSSSTSTCPSGSTWSYQGADGNRQQPVMIHRALFGSVERFIGVLTEHYAGAFPPWLAPVQVIGVPVADEYVDYLVRRGATSCGRNGIRVEVDTSDDRMPKKIRNASKAKVPVRAHRRRGGHGARVRCSFRYRDGSQRNGVPVAEAIERDRDRGPRPGPGLSPAVEGRPDVGTPDDFAGDAGRLRTAVDPAPDGLPRRREQAGQRDDPAELPVLPRSRPGRDEDGLIVHRGDVGVRGAQPLPVQPGSPDGLPVPARRRLRRT